MRQALAGLPWDGWRLQAAVDVLARPGCEVALLGRVGPGVVSEINQRLQCRLRVFSEERGMKALGRLASRSVTSLLGHYYQAVGSGVFPCPGAGGGCGFSIPGYCWPIWDATLRQNSAFVPTWAGGGKSPIRGCGVHAACLANGGAGRSGGHSLVSGGLRLLVATLAGRAGKEFARIKRTRIGELFQYGRGDPGGLCRRAFLLALIGAWLRGGSFHNLRFWNWSGLAFPGGPFAAVGFVVRGTVFQ